MRRDNSRKAPSDGWRYNQRVAGMTCVRLAPCISREAAYSSLTGVTNRFRSDPVVTCLGADRMPGGAGENADIVYAADGDASEPREEE